MAAEVHGYAIEYIGDSLYDAGDTLPDNTSPLLVTVEPKLTATGDHVMRIQADPAAFLKSGGPISFLSQTTLHKVTNIGDGVVAKIDLSGMPSGGGAVNLTLLAGEYDDLSPVGQVQNYLSCHIDNSSFAASFTWQGVILPDSENPYGFYTIDQQGTIDFTYDPFSMTYIALLNEGGGYWGMRVGSTLSGLATPHGDFPASEFHHPVGAPPEYSRAMLVDQPAMSRKPMFIPDFYVDLRADNLGNGSGYADLAYWHVQGMDVVPPFPFPWAVAVDGEWHGTQNLAAGYVGPLPTDLDWGQTYPQRLGS